MWCCVPSLQSQVREEQTLILKARKANSIKHGSSADVTFPLLKVFPWFIESSRMRVTEAVIFTDTFAEKVRVCVKQFRVPLVRKGNVSRTVISLSALATVLSPCSLFMFHIFCKPASSLSHYHSRFTASGKSLEGWGLASNQINKYDISGFYWH